MLAPLLPIIQCSGTGKSRLIHSLRRQTLADNTSYRTILLASRDEDHAIVKDESYDRKYVIGNTTEVDDSIKERDKLRALVIELCEDCCKGESQHKVTLFFDEAQHLVSNNGFLLRVLRWITRERNFTIKQKCCMVTVVLVGTSSSLANPFPEPEKPTRSSRHVDSDDSYHPPFTMLRTMGCLMKRFRPIKSQSEYEQMISSSRPLFALLHSRNELTENGEFEIAMKIVLGKGSGWSQNDVSCLSVLGTRPKDSSPDGFNVSCGCFGVGRQGSAAACLKDSSDKLRQDGINRCLFILAICGQDRPNGNVGYERYTQHACATESLRIILQRSLVEMNKAIVARIVCLHEDEFGIHNALLSGSLQMKHQASEVYEIHSELVHESFGYHEDKSSFDYGTLRYRQEARDLLLNTINCITEYEDQKPEPSAKRTKQGPWKIESGNSTQKN